MEQLGVFLYITKLNGIIFLLAIEKYTIRSKIVTELETTSVYLRILWNESYKLGEKKNQQQKQKNHLDDKNVIKNHIVDQLFPSPNFLLLSPTTWMKSFSFPGEGKRIKSEKLSNCDFH